MAKGSKADQGRGSYRLSVPLDASGVEKLEADRVIKVVARDQRGAYRSTTLRLEGKGAGVATLDFEKNPGRLTLAIGPADASDEELFGLQTLQFEVPAKRWTEAGVLKLATVVIPPAIWWWWWHWCRKFTIRGRVLCPDGSPVPGATVCAFDVNWWWWWTSRQQVGCATTDATGSFQISFTWCCGWWPWWWWRSRFWTLERSLAERIVPVLQQDPRLFRTSTPTPKPSAELFQSILGAPAVGKTAAVDPGIISSLRDRLLERLPRSAELERLRVWPWWPWQPWWDCSPDIIFKVTQNCGDQDRIIVDETFANARWDISTSLDVNLIAHEACCIPPPCHDPRECPEGQCVILSNVCCGVSVDNIGGNPGAPAAPAGFANPGVASTSGDAPFGGTVSISGVFGALAAADYYEFEWKLASALPAAFAPLPGGTAAGPTHRYFGHKLGGGPLGIYAVAFPIAPIGGKDVIETRHHFEANNDPGSWGITRWWVSDLPCDTLVSWLTEGNFADETYELRLVAYDAAGVNLANRRVLPLCDTKNDNGLVLTIDNRVVGPGSGHPPSAPDHPCGGTSVHLCTLEPDTDFVAIRVNGNPVGACSNINAKEGGSLEIDFFAYDPDGHLAYYELVVRWGENSQRYILESCLSLPGATLTPLGGVPGIPAAAQVGWTYDRAIAQGGPISPIWAGGAMRLHIPDLRCVFPETCCYLLELSAYKRTIVNCDGNYPHRNVSTITFGVVI
jgi:hypothetical protein